MRIGLVTGEYPPQQGGVGDFTHRLTLALTALGHEMHVITRTAGKTQIPNPESQTPNPNVHRVISHWNWPSLLQVRRLARELELDVIDI
ncbi:MAG: glycosyltransferase, partial [Chloroflexi bacterium]|nr:glycosyltransferase [Chloroflexota bacterium]